jgi:hypothetical protein
MKRILETTKFGKSERGEAFENRVSEWQDNTPIPSIERKSRILEYPELRGRVSNRDGASEISSDFVRRIVRNQEGFVYLHSCLN